MTTQQLYEVILTSRWFIAEHTCILIDLLEGDDPAAKSQRNKVINLILNTGILENHYFRIDQSGESSLITGDELMLLIERNNILSELPIKKK